MGYIAPVNDCSDDVTTLASALWCMNGTRLPGLLLLQQHRPDLRIAVTLRQNAQVWTRPNMSYCEIRRSGGVTVWPAIAQSV
jgi:hypothetical protein